MNRSPSVVVCVFLLVGFQFQVLDSRPVQAQLGAVFPSLAPVETINVKELKGMLDKQKAAEATAEQKGEKAESSFVLVDVRSDKEIAVSLIPGAITKEQFEKESQKYKDKTVIVYCLSGGRSGRYASQLRGKDFDVKNFKPSILGWCGAELPVVTTEGESTNRVHVFSDRYKIPAKYEAVTE
ncbi:rhodanese-like domain-containing protein [Stieleria sp. JC731]|uniref:rhodanese-like domain-containing protein n=1 Tax=Pirellulaceae TaxID=2691357 RepID=UPI001E3B4EA4|nr:rhodanese-like domain-containing protein [Stieleria sp. JC731]MCC9604085.1 rhodanese-like domain-containing protein [Stieleria sp. JC731]